MPLLIAFIKLNEKNVCVNIISEYSRSFPILACATELPLTSLYIALKFPCSEILVKFAPYLICKWSRVVGSAIWLKRRLLEHRLRKQTSQVKKYSQYIRCNREAFVIEAFKEIVESSGANNVLWTKFRYIYLGGPSLLSVNMRELKIQQEGWLLYQRIIFNMLVAFVIFKVRVCTLVSNTLNNKNVLYVQHILRYLKYFSKAFFGCFYRFYFETNIFKT